MQLNVNTFITTFSKNHWKGEIHFVEPANTCIETKSEFCYNLD